jgi:purine-binding chemotaxis protein CheW
MAATDNQWVIFKLGDNHFGMSINYTKEMVQLPRINRVPNVPPYVKGAAKLRDRVLPVIDLRMRLGLKSLDQEKEELIDHLTAREGDHVRWLEELEKSVGENRPFALSRDPHQCAFGKWYDAFRTNDRTLAAQLKKFDAPHRRIHALADEVLNLAKKGRQDEAIERIGQSRETELAELINLFEATRNLIRERHAQVYIIAEMEGRLTGLSVDEVLVVRKIEPDQIQPPPPMTAGVDQRFLLGMADPDGKREQLLLLLDAPKVIGGVAELTVGDTEA